MKNKLFYISFLVVCFGCSKKDSTTQPSTVISWDGSIVAYAPAPVSKAVSKKVFAHILPWFETPATIGSWGYHWKMANENPYVTLPNGQKDIASWYYPMIGPYASSDTTVIDYQLLLMKLSGIDGVFIDWPGTVTFNDLPRNLANSNVIISRLAKAGLKYAIVYEDNNLQYTNSKIATAQADMTYMQDHYFSNGTYETVSNKPLLLDFGPQQINNPTDWNTIFSVLSNKPSFVTYMFNQGAGNTIAGQFAWVEQSNINRLNQFYNTSFNPGIKISAAYPGFNSYYAKGGGSGPTWVITPSVSLFQQTLTLALQQPNDYIQLVTWNDYGEGTIIEPTVQFGYSYLTTLQQQLQVQSSLNQSDLEAVNKLYTARTTSIQNYDLNKLNELEQIYYDMVSMRMDSAKALLQKDF